MALVADVMTRGVRSLSPSDSLQLAAQAMDELNVGVIPVCEDGRVIGVVTDRDITIRSVAEGHDPRKDRVRDTMSTGIVYCFEDQDTDEAARLMREKHVRRLAVLNRDKRLVGMVSLGDLAQMTDQNMCGKALEEISTAPPNR